MYQGAVFFDYDGTLVDELDHISRPTEDTIQSLEALKKNNYLVALCTGRAKCYVPQFPFEFSSYITSNGACAEIENQMIHNNCFSEKEVIELVRYFQENQINYIFETRNKCYCASMEEEHTNKMFERFKLPLKNFVPLGDFELGGINKIIITYQTPEALKKFLSIYGDVYRVDEHSNGLHSCDIGKKDNNKAVGIQAVIDHLEMDIRRTYAFGDGSNDVEMMRTVGTGIAMGRHSPTLDGVANYITDKVVDNGLTNALIKFGLIGEKQAIEK